MITAGDVRAVYETQRGDDEITPFIAIAQAFIDAHLSTQGLSVGALKEVQRFLAGHFLFVTDTGVHESLRVEDIAERFTKSEKHPGLLDSRWGRTAVMFDTSGTLAGLAQPKPQAELRLFTPS